MSWNAGLRGFRQVAETRLVKLAWGELLFYYMLGSDPALWPAGGRREGELIAHDKGYYHSCFGRTRRKLAFGHTRRLEPQPWGAVTRRAVAQRRSRASGLTRLSAAAIRGVWIGFCCRSVSPVPPQYFLAC